MSSTSITETSPKTVFDFVSSEMAASRDDPSSDRRRLFSNDDDVVCHHHHHHHHHADADADADADAEFQVSKSSPDLFSWYSNHNLKADGSYPDGESAKLLPQETAAKKKTSEGCPASCSPSENDTSPLLMKDRQGDERTARLSSYISFQEMNEQEQQQKNHPSGSPQMMILPQFLERLFTSPNVSALRCTTIDDATQMKIKSTAIKSYGATMSTSVNSVMTKNWNADADDEELGNTSRTESSNETDKESDNDSSSSSMDNNNEATCSIEQSDDEEDDKDDRVGFLLVCLVILLGDMSRGIFFPSLWPLIRMLGGSQVTLGYSVAAFSCGRAIASPFFGSWSTERGYRMTLLMSCSILLLGTLLSTQIQSVGRTSFLIFCQTILGVGSGTLGVTR